MEPLLQTHRAAHPPHPTWCGWERDRDRDKMDVDDLFGAFDGEEKVSNVQAADPCAEDGKRKAGSDAGTAVGQPVAKRQTLPADTGDKREPDPVTAKGKERGVVLKESEESSTLREDGTFVKSVRTMHCWKASCGSPLQTATPLKFASSYIRWIVLHTLHTASSPPSLDQSYPRKLQTRSFGISASLRQIRPRFRPPILGWLVCPSCSPTGVHLTSTSMRMVCFFNWLICSRKTANLKTWSLQRPILVSCFGGITRIRGTTGCRSVASVQGQD